MKNAAVIAMMLIVVTCATAQDHDWVNYKQTPASDGSVELSAVWVKHAPAYNIVSENGAMELSKFKGATYEFFVLLKNVSDHPITVPSSPKGGLPIQGLPVEKISDVVGAPPHISEVLARYMIQFTKVLDRIQTVDAEQAFLPVTLRPGESVKLPVYYWIARSGETFPEHWFYYSVAPDIARRYGWWTGALACKGKVFNPPAVLP